MKRLIIISGIFAMLCGISCKKYLEVGIAATDLSSATLFEHDATATAAQLSIYSQMEKGLLPFYLIQDQGICSDEMINYLGVTDNIDLANNNLLATNSQITALWTQLYSYVYQANAILEGIGRSTALTSAVRQQLRGEALFVRAYCYYWLTTLYGNVPWVNTTSYKTNATMGRTDFDEVLNNIANDLEEARTLLTMDYKSGENGTTSERVRPNRGAAAALLARIRLWQQDWVGAELAASEVIGSTVYSLELDLDMAFLKDSREAIWQLQAVVEGYSSMSAYYLIIESSPSDVALQPELLQSFAATDQRAVKWINSIDINGETYLYPYKYKAGYTGGPATEYTILLRLGEQYLIRAEARARQNKLVGAEADLNAIRIRAGLYPLTGLNQTDLLDRIAQERRWELFAESDRWLDLKRTGKADIRMPLIKGSNWNTTDQLYPIPQSEINRNPNLTQNPGY